MGLKRIFGWPHLNSKSAAHSNQGNTGTRDTFHEQSPLCSSGLWECHWRTVHLKLTFLYHTMPVGSAINFILWRMSEEGCTKVDRNTQKPQVGRNRTRELWMGGLTSAVLRKYKNPAVNQPTIFHVHCTTELPLLRRNFFTAAHGWLGGEFLKVLVAICRSRRSKWAIGPWDNGEAERKQVKQVM